MDTITILTNQAIIMKALICINEMPDYIKKELKEQIMFINARIIALQ